MKEKSRYLYLVHTEVGDTNQQKKKSFALVEASSIMEAKVYYGAMFAHLDKHIVVDVEMQVPDDFVKLERFARLENISVEDLVSSQVIFSNGNLYARYPRISWLQPTPCTDPFLELDIFNVVKHRSCFIHLFVNKQKNKEEILKYQKKIEYEYVAYTYSTLPNEINETKPVTEQLNHLLENAPKNSDRLFLLSSDLKLSTILDIYNVIQGKGKVYLYEESTHNLMEIEAMSSYRISMKIPNTIMHLLPL